MLWGATQTSASYIYLSTSEVDVSTLLREQGAGSREKGRRGEGRREKGRREKAEGRRQKDSFHIHVWCVVTVS